MAAKVGFSGPVPGHDWAGWTAIRDLDPAGREQLVELLAPAIGSPALPDLEALLTGRVPLCECGWHGDPVRWHELASESRRSSEYEDHVAATQANMMAQAVAAEAASAALELAAEAWKGDPSVSDWLQARARFIGEVGVFDGERWPTARPPEIGAASAGDPLVG